MSIFRHRDYVPSLVNQLRRNQIASAVFTLIAAALAFACALTCQEFFRQANKPLLWLSALILTMALNQAANVRYVFCALKYLCQHKADAWGTNKLSADQQTSRYRRGCWAGFLSVLIAVGTIVFAFWIMFQLKHPSRPLPPFAPSMWLLLVAIAMIVQIVVTIKTALNIRSTTKWWRKDCKEARDAGQTLMSFAQYAHEEFDYDEDED